MHKKAYRSTCVPFGDFDWCPNEECPKANTCGRSTKRLEFLPRQVMWCMAVKPAEDGSCDFEMPYRTYARALVLPELKAMKDDVSEAIGIIRKLYDGDGTLDNIQTILESVEERVSYLLTGFEKGEKKQ